MPNLDKEVEDIHKAIERQNKIDRMIVWMAIAAAIIIAIGIALSPLIERLLK